MLKRSLLLVLTLVVVSGGLACSRGSHALPNGLLLALAVLETGEDGRAVLEAIFAAYQSAGTGQKVSLPLESTAAKPFDLWKSQ